MRKSPYGINRKKRNIRYIRQKNSIRNYKILTYFYPVSEEFIEDKDNLSDILSELINNDIDRVFKIYKTNVDYIKDSITIGQTEEGFLENYFHVKLKYQRTKN